MPRRKPAVVTAFRPGSGQPVVTYTIIALCVLIWVLQILPNSPVTRVLVYWPPLTAVEPWRMLTSVFAHSQGSIFHILLNMYSLFIFGPILERLLGRIRFLALYLISGFGGSVAVLLLAPSTAVLGASGAIFGLLGAFFVIQRRLGGNNIQLLIVIGINLVIGFLPGFNISWQAHVGGLIAGAAVAFVYLRTRRPEQRNLQILLVSLVAVALIALTIVGVIL
jgi:membrane associated rhomboid family serine protease